MATKKMMQLGRAKVKPALRKGGLVKNPSHGSLKSSKSSYKC